MTDPNDSFFADLRRAVDDNEAGSLQAFEDRVVRQALSTANLLAIAEGRGAMGPVPTGRTFQWLQEEYPRFPVRLKVGKFDWLHQLSCGAVIGDISWFKLPFFKALDLFALEEGLTIDHDECGIVFPWAHLKGGSMMILHNRVATLNNASSKRGVQALYHAGDPPICFILESLKSFILGLGSDWLTR